MCVTGSESHAFIPINLYKLTIISCNNYHLYSSISMLTIHHCQPVISHEYDKRWRERNVFTSHVLYLVHLTSRNNYIIRLPFRSPSCLLTSVTSTTWHGSASSLTHLSSPTSALPFTASPLHTAPHHWCPHPFLSPFSHIPHSPPFLNLPLPQFSFIFFTSLPILVILVPELHLKLCCFLHNCFSSFHSHPHPVPFLYV